MRSAADLVSMFVLACVTTLACTPVSELLEREPASPGPTRIVFDIPAGAHVSLDGIALGATPIAAVETTPGAHVVKLWTQCGREEPPPVQVELGSTRTLGRDAFPGLRFAKLHLTMRSLHDEPIAPKVFFDRSEVTLDANGDAELVVCNQQRLRIESGHPELGGYMETLDLRAGETLTRDVVLAPGPDMVRLPGGDFTVGMTLADEAAMEEDDSEVPRRETKIAAFELDKSPVTAAQWNACKKAGSCNYDQAQWGTLRKAYQFDDQCSTDIKFARPIKAGRAEHPMNCVARWEAELYCSWAGKRLPTMDEWEYAARGGDDQNNCPWGVAGDEICDRRPVIDWQSPDVAEPVCSFMRDDSIQGICDLASRLGELVTDTRPVGQGRCNDSEGFKGDYRGPTKSAHTVGWSDAECEARFEQLPLVTFRCARDLSVLDRGRGGS